MTEPATYSPSTEILSPYSRRRRLLIITTFILLVALLGYGIWWFLFARNTETTDDAYVAGNVVQVTPQVAGTVVAIHADDTELVQAGQPLVELDRADTRVALDQAEAQLAQTVREVNALYSNNAALEAAVASREAELDRARADLERRQQLTSIGAVSKEELEHALTGVKNADSALRAAREQLAANRALTQGTTTERHPNVQRDAAQLRAAWLAHARSVLPAPVTGHVAKRSVQVGQRVSPGMPLLSVVPLNALWVDANFKEVQLAKMRIGQPVRLESDLYGSDIEYHGKVVGLAAGTGSAFALLPAQNASGNWIKVVQRVPVRISLDPADLEKHPLRIGVSMTAKVDVSKAEGTSLTAREAGRAAPAYRTDVFDALTKEADARIAQIIAANSRPAGGKK